MGVRAFSMKQPAYDCRGASPVAVTLDVVTGKWKGVILYHLFGGARRFGELGRLLPGVSHRVLALQLRDLESAGLVARRAHAEMPPRVEYSLTDLGRTLEPLVRLMRDWGEAYLRRLSQEALRWPPPSR
jgi:DNA-binding HxlR family transcriptional regulator